MKKAKKASELLKPSWSKRQLTRVGVFEHLALFGNDDAETCPLQPDLASENESRKAFPKTDAECVRIDGINKILYLLS
jgi:hypothetical protein